VEEYDTEMNVGDFVRVRPTKGSPRTRVEDLIAGRIGTVRALFPDYAGYAMAVVDLHLRENVYGPLPTVAARGRSVDQGLIVVPQAALEVTSDAPHRSTTPSVGSRIQSRGPSSSSESTSM
jgi:hypothetical protein